MADDENVIDDDSIPDDSLLYRRLHQSAIVFDHNEGDWRISSAGFEDTNGSPMSVDLGQVIQNLDESPVEYCLSGYPQHGLASIAAADARNLNQRVAKEPLEENPAHGVVAGPKTDSTKKKFRRQATFLVNPKSQE